MSDRLTDTYLHRSSDRDFQGVSVFFVSPFFPVFQLLPPEETKVIGKKGKPIFPSDLRIYY